MSDENRDRCDMDQKDKGVDAVNHDDVHLREKNTDNVEGRRSLDGLWGSGVDLKFPPNKFCCGVCFTTQNYNIFGGEYSFKNNYPPSEFREFSRF